MTHVDVGVLQPLTSKQSAAWSSFQRGITAIEIAKRMKTTRQNVHQTLKIAEVKISKTLLDVARSNGLEIKALQPEKGILLGYNPLLKRNVVVTYTSKNGVRVWYWYDNPEKIDDEKLLQETREYLLNEAEERGIRLTLEEKNTHPARLARAVFSRLLPEVRS